MLRKAPIFAAIVALACAVPAISATTHREPREVEFSFDNPVFGRYDQQQLQRGYKVYHEVCAACHSLNQLSFRNLGDRGGPFWDPRYPNPNDNPVVKALAHEIQVADIDPETGDVIHRPAIPADRFPAPFANDAAAAASNGQAIPPDMSLLARAREGGARYIYSIVTGYQPTPAGLTGLTESQHYNPYMSGDLGSYWHGQGPVPEGGVIAMPPPLRQAGQVTYDDGTNPTVDQMAEDVSAFLQWAADPHMEERKETGLAVMIFLIAFAGIVYASYRKIWEHIDH